MKGGPRAATALRRRRLDSTCGTTQPGPGAESWGGGLGAPLGGLEHPLGGPEYCLGGPGAPCGSGSTLGELECPPRTG